MTLNYNPLRGKIREVVGTEKAFAKAVGISRASLYSKMNMTTEFTTSEIMRSCEVLGIPKEEIWKYFFAQNVKKTER